MEDALEKRVRSLAIYMIENKSTIRSAARYFSISKSTVHKDITERLEKINPTLAKETKDILLENKMERHIRGGIATRQKYLKKNTV